MTNMMLSKSCMKYAEEAYSAAIPAMPLAADELKKNLEGLTKEESILMKLLYGTLPASDVLSVEKEVFLSYIRHALFLREKSPYCKDLPEDIFLHFVFYPRVNSEDLVDCRLFFYDLLKDRIKGLSGENAVLEINRFCCENVTYEASDSRTENPLTAYNSGTGRCGEESVFTVTALRSVGIPARQVYVPYWSHCDDNHAWVEAFVDGKWCFLGACEPEPVLNRGWFTDASSRALLVHYRTFMEFTGEGMKAEKSIEKQGCCSIYPVTERYAPVTDLNVRVLSPEGRPVSGAVVQFMIVNMGGLRPIAVCETDKAGYVSMKIGRGSLWIEVLHKNLYAVKQVNAGAQAMTVDLKLEKADRKESKSDWDMIPPVTTAVNRSKVSRKALLDNEALLAECRKKREERFAEYMIPKIDRMPDWLWKGLNTAGENLNEIMNALNNCTDSKEQLLIMGELLESLSLKDFKDTSMITLLGHVFFSLDYQGREHFKDAILCPRVGNEKIEMWRMSVGPALRKQKPLLKKPKEFFDYLTRNYPEGDLRYYPALTTPISAALKGGHADEKGRRLLFVSFCRCYGIASRLDPNSGHVTIWKDGRFVDAECDAGEGKVCLRKKSAGTLRYGCDYTLAVLCDNRYQVLEEPEIEAFGDDLIVTLPTGEYRLVTSNRLPNGRQLCRVSYLKVSANQTTDIDLVRREAEPKEMLNNIPLAPLSFSRQDGTSFVSSGLTEKLTAFIWLEPGKEPTEHILNEMIASASVISKKAEKGLKLRLIVKNKEALNDSLLQKACQAVPSAEVCFDDFGFQASALARSMFLEPGLYPLVVLTDRSHTGIFGSCGYRVGSMELLLKLTDCLI